MYIAVQAAESFDTNHKTDIAFDLNGKQSQPLLSTKAAYFMQRTGPDCVHTPPSAETRCQLLKLQPNQLYFNNNLIYHRALKNKSVL